MSTVFGVKEYTVLESGGDMSISSVGSNGVGYDNLSSMSKITTASDNAAGLSISQKMESQTRGYDAGTNNMEMSKDAINVADGALSSMTDALQRIRELAVQASNTAVYSAEDISSMQNEVDQWKQSIADTAKNTQFNTHSFLDGSMADTKVATDANGGGMSIQFANTTLDTLGIADFDLTGDYSIDTIDQAIKAVSSSRSSLGAQSSALDYAINNNNTMSENLNGSKSSLEDLDVEDYVSEKEKDRILEQYQLFMQKEEMDNNNQAVLMNKMFT